ncbi:SDR family NAD(P)-dependent oxidoreductase [Microbacterium sp. HD4P20]|uniref:SDR family NAD(P)-dependent oxidoreductase n=1 Tax=Microbacterium sp. HD4P20 TaxID=2864874 RepID=UPI001C63E626|nr:SDR family NAD(P)-dependent oxidoreductase [Microbacterium sp. HD4P20]MCP2636598.1 SDR family NAD(P)-dependent oxidoreductase [Microbacterium sp. HD4P20]
MSTFRKALAASLEDVPVVVITGASSGIGRATAHEYARRSERLVLASRSATALEPVAAECRVLGAEVRTVATDVSSEEAVEALATYAIAHFGRIDVWVGNAGVMSYGTFERTPPRIFRQVVDTNLMGQVHGARAVLPHFRRQGHGTLVLVGSLYSRVGSPQISPYVTSKFGLLGFAESLRQELRGSGIRLRLILPATIDTPIYHHAANVTGHRVHPLPPASSPRRVARAIVRAPHRRRFATFVGRAQRAGLLLHGVAPRAYDAVVSFLKHRVELRGDGAKPVSGNVLTPSGVAGAVTGGWRRWPERIGSGMLVAGAALLIAGVARRR